MLPYMEQKAIYNAINFNLEATTTRTTSPPTTPSTSSSARPTATPAPPNGYRNSYPASQGTTTFGDYPEFNESDYNTYHRPRGSSASGSATRSPTSSTARRTRSPPARGSPAARSTRSPAATILMSAGLGRPFPDAFQNPTAVISGLQTCTSRFLGHRAHLADPRPLLDLRGHRRRPSSTRSSRRTTTVPSGRLRLDSTPALTPRGCNYANSRAITRAAQRPDD